MAGPIAWRSVPGIRQAAAFNDKRRQSRTERLAHRKVEMEQAEARAREAQGTPQAASSATMTVAPKTAPLQGTITTFDRDLAAALMHGYKRDDSMPTAEANIRTVLGNAAFANVISTATAESPLATPLEGVDGKCAESMRKVRTALATGLATGNVPSLSTDELDVLYTAILGNGELWGNELAWPRGVQTPPEAFFGFLAAAASRNMPGHEGEFVADILLTLASTITRNEAIEEGVKMRAGRTLGSTQFIDNALAKRADPEIERAVACFRGSIDEALSTPTTQICSLGTPGFGYDCRLGLVEALEERKAAGLNLTEAKRGTDATNIANAEERVRRANARLLQLAPELGNAGPEEVKRIIAGLIENECAASAVSARLQDQFRAVFLDVCRAGLPADDAALNTVLDKLGDRGHPLVIGLVTGLKNTLTTRIAHGTAAVAGEIEALEQEIAAAGLPEDVKGKLAAVAVAMKREDGQPPSEADMQKIADLHAYPVREAVRCIIKAYMTGMARPGELSPIQWVTARLRFQGEPKPGNNPSVKYEGKFLVALKRDFNHIINWEFPDNKLLKLIIQAGMVWPVPYYPGKWFMNAAFKNKNFSRETREWSRLTNRLDRDGNRKRSWFKNKYKGYLQAFTAWAMVAEMATALGVSMHHNGLFNGTWKYVARAPWNYVTAAPGSLRLQFWTWMTPQASDQDFVAVNDNPNIPERLAGRGHAYYQKAYGVGCDTSTDAKAEKAKERLAFIQGRPELLRFLQERTSGMRVNSWDDDGPKVVDSTKRIRSSLRMDTTLVEDGLRLNTGNADKFVDTLIGMEGRKANGTNFLGMKKKISYAFMEAGKLKWEDAGFLVPAGKREAMLKCRITDDDNALFLMLQPGVLDRVTVLAELGRSDQYLVKPDEFVRLWRAKVAAIAGIDPITAAVPATAIDQGFDSAKAAAWGGSIRDATPQYERAAIMSQVKAPNMSQTTIDILEANEGIRKLLLQFTETTSGYLLEPGRVNDFVQRLMLYKQARHDINDYNPFSSPQGRQVAWAMGQGYFSDKRFSKDAVNGAGDTTGTPALAPNAHGGSMSADATAFYAGTGAAPLNAILTQMKAGNTARQEVYELLTDSSDHGKAMRKLATMEVSGSGPAMKVTIGNVGRAKQWLARTVK